MNLDSQDIIIHYLRSQKKYRDRNVEKLFMDTFVNNLMKNSTDVIAKSPLWVGLKLTSDCNFQCVHCWVNKKEGNRSTDEVRLAIDKLKQMEIIHITLSGGEPFLRDDIIEIIRYVKSKRICLEIFTNGALLNKQIIIELSKILDLETDAIQVSLDAAIENTFYEQRKSKDFKKILRNIQLLKENHIKVRINFTATHINVNELAETYILCEQYNIDTFSVSHVFDLKNGIKLYKKVGIKRYIDEIVKCIEINNKYRCDLRVFIPIEFHSETANKTQIMNTNIKQKDYQLGLYWFIHSNGDIYPDVTLEYEELKLGNIYQDDVLKLCSKHQDINLCLIDRDLSNTKCAYCNKYEICKGGEIGRVYRKYGHINYPDENCHFTGGRV